jgi:hypothetical protein
MNATVTMPRSVADDFPDWVNPFVVKELRQGLHSRIFISVFVALHACVALVMVFGLFGDMLQPEQFMQWFVEASFVCLVLPVGAYFSVADEVKADSLELIRVAGVTSGQMVMGKWQAQLSQASLLLVSVAPYHLLQYYLNHEGPLGQLALLYTCWLFSVVMSAAMMFFATLKLGGKMGCLLFGGPMMLLPLAFVLGPVVNLLFHASSSGVVVMIVETIVFGVGLLFFLSLAVSGLDMRVRAIPSFLPTQDWDKRFPL